MTSQRGSDCRCPGSGQFSAKQGSCRRGGQDSNATEKAFGLIVLHWARVPCFCHVTGWQRANCTKFNRTSSQAALSPDFDGEPVKKQNLVNLSPHNSVSSRKWTGSSLKWCAQ